MEAIVYLATDKDLALKRKIMRDQISGCSNFGYITYIFKYVVIHLVSINKVVSPGMAILEKQSSIVTKNVTHVQHLSNTLHLLSACFTLYVKVENVRFYKQVYFPDF